MNENEDATKMTVYKPQAVQAAQDMRPLSSKEVVEQVALIQQIMKDVMKKDEHYGVIPGCGDKPTLLKAGAEKLSMTFRLCPKLRQEVEDMGRGHRLYRTLCSLYDIEGRFLGDGVGEASTMETKWRFRNTTTPTGDPIPDDYKQNKGGYRAKGFVCKKDEASGEWAWCKFEKVEHDNPADNYNTVAKMSKKRAFIDAILTRTAASDIFTQDIEELRDNGVLESKEEQDHKPPVATTAKTPSPLLPKTPATPAPATPATPPAAPATPPAAGNLNIYEGVIKDAGHKNGETNGKPWCRTYCKDADGGYFSTFDTKIGEAIETLAGSEVRIAYKTEKGPKGESKTVISIEPLARPPVENAQGQESTGNDDLPF